MFETLTVGFGLIIILFNVFQNKYLEILEIIFGGAVLLVFLFLNGEYLLTIGGFFILMIVFLGRNITGQRNEIIFNKKGKVITRTILTLFILSLCVIIFKLKTYIKWVNIDINQDIILGALLLIAVIVFEKVDKWN